MVHTYDHWGSDSEGWLYGPIEPIEKITALEGWRCQAVFSEWRRLVEQDLLGDSGEEGGEEEEKEQSEEEDLESADAMEVDGGAPEAVDGGVPKAVDGGVSGA